MTGALIIYLSMLLFTPGTGFINVPGNMGSQDLHSRNPLLNGRIWRNGYPRAQGHQFFITGYYVKGSVVFDGRRYEGLDLKYDIAGDELILWIDSYPVIIMNKEMVDSFSLRIENKDYIFFNAGNDTTRILSGYVNLLYSGPTALYARYSKKVQPLAVDGIYDLFIDEKQVFIQRDTIAVQVGSRRSLLRTLGIDRRTLNRIQDNHGRKISAKDPSSYVGLLEYYDSIPK